MWLRSRTIGLAALILIIVTRIQATEVESQAQANSSSAATASDANSNDESDNPAVAVIANDDIEGNTDDLTDVKEAADEAAKTSAVHKNNAAVTESVSATKSLNNDTSNSSVSEDSIMEVKPNAAAAGGSSSTHESSTLNPISFGSDVSSLEQGGINLEPTDLFDGSGSLFGNSAPPAGSTGAAEFGRPIYGNGFFPDFNFHNYGNGGPDDIFINGDSLFYEIPNQDSVLIIGAVSRIPRIDTAFPGSGPGVASSNRGSWSGSSSQSSSNSDGGGSSRSSSFGISSRSNGNDENSPGNGVKGVYSSTSLDIDSSGKGVYKVSAGKIH